MKRPSVFALLVPVVGVFAMLSPGAALFAIGASVVIGAAFLVDRICCALEEPARLAVKRLLHRRCIKPPASLVANGVVLTVVLFSLGFLWNSLPVRISLIPSAWMLSMLNIAAHLLSLGSFVCLLGFLQYAPDFRGSRG